MKKSVNRLRLTLLLLLPSHISVLVLHRTATQVLVTVTFMGFIVWKVDTLGLLIVLCEGLREFCAEGLRTEEFVMQVLRLLQVVVFLILRVDRVEYVCCYGDGHGGISALL